MLKRILGELEEHAPFTALGTVVGVLILAIIVLADMPSDASERLFETFHPAHVVFSAMVTTAIYRLHTKGSWWAAILIGYTGSIGIATLSDSVIPYLGESLLDLPRADAHIGFIEEWWLVNPAAFLGIAVGFWKPKTKFPHGAHVLLSISASLFHITMALGETFNWILILPIFLFLFLAVIVPCCTSDIIYPLLFARESMESHAH